MTDITRRGFLKGAGMAAGALAFTSLTPMTASAANQRGKGVLTAGRMGPMLCGVKDGKLVSTTNALAQTVPNSLQTTGPDQVHTKARVKYPMVRKGFLDNPSAPTEFFGKAKGDELQLMTAHAAHRLHSQFNYAKIREEYAIGNREPISINVEDAKARGIKKGDFVRAYNERGQVLVGAFVTDGIKQGAVCIHEGGWPDLDKETGLCKNGGCNVLTWDIPTSRLANGCAANSALVKIEKYTGRALELTAVEPPKNG